MIAFRFGPAERQLYGVYHAGDTRSREARGVLLCNPFGQEAIRTHRMYRVLADRLARAGVHVMRFDYGGTGDSAGDDDDANLDHWCDDIAAAQRELVHRARCKRVAWLGARLGGSLAALAASRTQHVPDRLVLWDPVIDGSAYRDELRAAHRRAIRSSYDIVPAGLELQPDGEAMGFACSDGFARQLDALDLNPLWPALSAELIVISSADKQRRDVLARQLSAPRQRLVHFEHAFDWTSEEALNTALVPPDAIARLKAHVEERA